MEYLVKVGAIRVKIIASSSSQAVTLAKKQLGNYPATIIDFKYKGK